MIRLALLIITVGLMALSAVPAAASPPAPGPAEMTTSYRLRPEDVIEITVLGIPQLDQTATILPDGTITFPRLNTIHVAGMTPTELQQWLYSRLDLFYNNLEITVTVKTLRTDWVTVRGAVRSPGIYPLHPGWTVRQLLAAAGDLAIENGPPAPEQMRATLIRKSGERIPLNLAQLLAQQGAPESPALEPDDLLLVEDMSIQVTVDGQVMKPGAVSLPPGATVLDALARAGGPTETAALTKAVLRRGVQTIPINLRQLLQEHSDATAFALQRFDSLHIPENKEKFLVLGGVQKPGPYAIPEDETLRLTDALGLAGGGLPRANLKAVDLLQKVAGKMVHSTVDVQEILKKGDVSHDLLVHPGDIIYVPDPKQPSGLNPLTILQSAALLFGL